MERPSVVLNFLIIILFFTKVSSSMMVNYVKPFTSERASPCSNMQRPCLTLNEYASNSDEYFINNTRFYFYSGIHRLKYTLNLVNLCNFSFLGWPNGGQVVTIAVDSSASITWNESWNIEISSIMFTLYENFTFIMRFERSKLVRLSNVSIHGNGYNGCSSIISEKSALEFINSMFFGLNGFVGAALTIFTSKITFRGNNVFAYNTAASGGSIYLINSTLIFNGTSLFRNNTSSQEPMNRKIPSCNNINLVREMKLRKVENGSGGAIVCHESYLEIYYYSIFTGNIAGRHGGAMELQTCVLNIQSNASFVENKASSYGGAMALHTCALIIQGNASFVENKASNRGGAMSTQSTSSHVNGNLFMNKNSADWGGAIAIRAGNFTINGYTTFDSNSAKSSSIITFQRNIATYCGGAIESKRSILTLTKSVLFEANTAYYHGGAMILYASKLILVPRLNVSFIKNDAYRGGALYIHDFQCLLAPIECFLSIQSSDPTTENISLHFENNSAGSTGSTLYGGQLNRCRLYYRTNNTIDKYGNRPFHNYNDDALKLFMNNMSRVILYNKTESATNISSQAEQIKFCQDKNIIMNSSRSIRAHLGEQFDVSVVALDQSGSPVPTKIFNKNKYEDDQYHLFPFVHSIPGACHNLSFQLYSLTTDDTCGNFKLYLQGPCQSLIDGLTLEITIESCPLGFELSKNQLLQCSCSKRLLKFTQKCSIDNSIAKIKREKNNFWISQKIEIDLDIKFVLIHEFRCPLDYCKDIPQDVILSDPSVQCDFNRTGIVCGQCQKDFSLALGSLHCIPCNNKYITLILFFVMAGVALIVVIIVFQLTVSIGTLNGLFFYSNIIQANHQAYFPRASTKFFRIFTSWLNLDLGIETCFYDGMNIYAYSWFQFLFPFYVWLLIGLIILICRYSRSIAKHFGQNPVAVLATLLLMSYSKILSAVIVPLTWTYLTYYNASNETKSLVWMYDASIPYFGEPKHTALGLFAILCIVVFVLPYILLLLFGHWLQGCSNWWILSWLNKIKPFMDAYHAPYRKHTRYWTGLLLITRLGLFLSFANDSESVNIVAVISASVALLAIRFRVYKHFYNDILESSFILNLTIFSVITFYLNEKSEDATKSQFILSSISVGIAFITFLGILLFHISLVLKSSNIWKNYMLPFIKKSLLLSKILRITPVKDQTRAGDKDAAELQALPTSTEINVDLREPLLEITES